MKQGEPIEILLIHRRAVEVGWVERALREGGLRHRLAVVGDDNEALAFLRRQGDFADAARPGLILLGLSWSDAPASASQPDLLSRLAADEALAAIPVVVVAASSESASEACPEASHALDRLIAHEIT